MRALTYRTAPLGQGWLPCVRCRRWRHPDDLERGYCKDERCVPPDGPSDGQRAALQAAGR